MLKRITLQHNDVILRFMVDIHRYRCNEDTTETHYSFRLSQTQRKKAWDSAKLDLTYHSPLMKKWLPMTYRNECGQVHLARMQYVGGGVFREM